MTGVQNTLDSDHHLQRAGPLLQSGDVATEGGIVDFVDGDTEESGSLFAWVLLKEVGVEPG